MKVKALVKTKINLPVIVTPLHVWTILSKEAQNISVSAIFSIFLGGRMSLYYKMYKAWYDISIVRHCFCMV